LVKKRITIDVRLYEPNRVVKPKDEISGVVMVKNEGKKDNKLNRAEIILAESYYKWQYDMVRHVDRWIPRVKILKKYTIDKGIIVKSGETNECEFKIVLPSKWKPKIKKRYSDWCLMLGSMKGALGIYTVNSLKGVVLKT